MIDEPLPEAGRAPEPPERTEASVLGDLLDALSDDLQREVSHTSGVRLLCREAATILGGPYEGYLDEWWMQP